jgi:hypothetical protein
MVSHYKIFYFCKTCAETWNSLIEDRAKSKMSTWRPSWILGSTGFRKEPSPGEAKPTKKCQVNLQLCSCVTVRNTKSKMSTWQPSWILGGTGFQNEKETFP